MTYKKQIAFECDWQKGEFVLGKHLYSFHDVKFDQTLKDILRANLDATEKAVLRLSYAEIYEELYEIEEVTFDIDHDPNDLKKGAMTMREYLKINKL
jgi:hypothetical protein